MSIILNLFAGPGSGKSTAMAGIFYELKIRGISCEMAPEFAKEKVWEQSTAILENQIYVFGKQLHTLHRLQGKVDVIVTDAPILFSLIYGEKESIEFHDLVKEVFGRFRNLNFFLRRCRNYDPNGRLQTEEGAKELDQKILDMMFGLRLPFAILNAERETIQKIAHAAEIELGKTPVSDIESEAIEELAGREEIEWKKRWRREHLDPDGSFAKLSAANEAWKEHFFATAIVRGERLSNSQG